MLSAPKITQTVLWQSFIMATSRSLFRAEEAVEPPEDFRGRSESDIMHYMLTKRLGAEVDYIVKGIDPKAGIAVASRLEAIAAKRKEYYFGTDRDGNNLIYNDVCAEARIVSVIQGRHLCGSFWP